jgi:hypothetical protein
MLLKTSALTFEEVRERYEHFRARCIKNMIKPKRYTMKNIKKIKNKKESGCTEPLYGEKSKCILQIVPQKEKCDTFQIDNKCVKKNMATILQEQNEIRKDPL